MAKGIAWVKVKKDYLEGVTPQELSEKYKIEIKKIYKKIENEKWAPELSEIKGNVGNMVQKRIARVTNLALDRLEDVLSDDEVKTSDLVNAIGKAFDISGLKSSKQELTGKDGAPLVQQTYLTPEECKAAINHIKDFINND